jgi:hypothetical protein
LPVSTYVTGISLGLVPFLSKANLKILRSDGNVTTTNCGIDAQDSLLWCLSYQCPWTDPRAYPESNRGDATTELRRFPHMRRFRR